MIASHHASSASSTCRTASRTMPALLTSTSSLPNASSVVATIRSASADTPTSAVTATPPIASATAAAFAPSMSATHTRAPSAA